MGMITDLASREEVRSLREQGEGQHCINLSRVSEVAQGLELDEDETELLYDLFHQRGIELRDDCGQDCEDSTYVNGELAAATTDALQLFLNEAARYPLLTAA